MKEPSTPSRVAFAILLVGFVLFMVSLGNCVQEDAFISFRYAANLVDGHGLVYNAGERVEGYTNFLWTVLLAGGMALGGDPVTLARFTAMACALALLGTVYVFARRDDAVNGTTGGLVAAALVAASPPIATEGVQGLETVGFALLVTVGVVCGISARRRLVMKRAAAAKTAVASGTVLALAAMTRPEGVGVLGLVLIGSLAWSLAGRRRWPDRADRLTVAVFACIYAPYWIWRFSYYGYPFPNTFYAKTGGGLRHVVRGLDYELDFLRHNPVLLLVTIAVCVGSWMTTRASRRRDARPSESPARDPNGPIVAVVVAGYLGYVALVGGDFKSTFRFIIPVLPLWALGVDRGLSIQLGQAGRSLRRWAVPVVVAAIVANGAMQVPRSRQWAAERTWDLQRRTAAGRWLASNAAPGDTLAIHSAGIVPYYSGLYTIDMWGLSDLHIGHREMPEMGDGLIGHEKTDPVYVFGRRPTYYVDEYAYVTSRPVEDFMGWVVSQYSLPELRRSYRVRSVPVTVREGERAVQEWFTFLELKAKANPDGS